MAGRAMAKCGAFAGFRGCFVRFSVGLSGFFRRLDMALSRGRPSGLAVQLHMALTLDFAPEKQRPTPRFEVPGMCFSPKARIFLQSSTIFLFSTSKRSATTNSTKLNLREALNKAKCAGLVEDHGQFSLQLGHQVGLFDRLSSISGPFCSKC